MNKLIITLLLSVCVSCLYSQCVNFGASSGVDLYSWYKNPIEHDRSEKSSGGILGSNLGLSLAFGKEDYSISIEGQSVLTLTSLNLQDYKGFISLGLPIMVRFNYKGINGFNKTESNGVYVGGGLQWNISELSRFDDFSYIDKHNFRVYLMEVGSSFGKPNNGYEIYVRLGLDTSNKSCSLNIGYNKKIYFTHRSKLKPEIEEDEQFSKKKINSL